MLPAAVCLVLVAAVPDTVRVARLAHAPVLDGSVSRAEYGEPAILIATAGGAAEVRIALHGDDLYVAATMRDSSFYWGDDFVVSLDPDGSGGAAPGSGDRQWYLRRTLDSSVVGTASGGRWPQSSMLGAAREGPG